MSKKKTEKGVTNAVSPVCNRKSPGPPALVSDEMLSELEAIVAEAEIRLRDEESLAWKRQNGWVDFH